MQATFHLNSAQEVSAGLLEAIKKTFESRPITITIEESEADFEISDEMKTVLDQRLKEPDSQYMSAAQSIEGLKMKYA